MNAQEAEGFFRLVRAIRAGQFEPIWHRALRGTLEFTLAELSRRTQTFDVAEHRILTVVSHGDDLTQQALAERTALDRTTTSETVRRLEERQLLRRVHHERDKRKLRILASPETHEAAATTAETARAAEQKAFSCLSPLEQEQLRALLKKAL